jgi:hypothetical protein
VVIGHLGAQLPELKNDYDQGLDRAVRLVTEVNLADVFAE